MCRDHKKVRPDQQRLNAAPVKRYKKLNNSLFAKDFAGYGLALKLTDKLN
jgi:hypothetical protein